MSTSLNRKKLESDLERDEGRVRLPYEDSVGKVSIGVGRNLDDRGLSDEEIDFLLKNDIDRVIKELDAFIPWWREQPEGVQRALANLNFNLGLDKFRKFKATLKLIEHRQYKAAAANFRTNRRYFTQVGARAERLAKLIESGL